MINTGGHLSTASTASSVASSYFGFSKNMPYFLHKDMLRTSISIRPLVSVNFVITLMYFMLAGVVVINTGGHLSTASAASSVAAAAAAAAGTPTGLIIPHSALVGNSLASLQQNQLQPPGTASGGSGSPSPTSGDKFFVVHYKLNFLILDQRFVTSVANNGTLLSHKKDCLCLF